ncbi:MAG: spore maturation protein A, partial [Oscillospiraceae bacterium]|nr:spore maturation protein A [Oscillospiraceae bacterium]
MAMGILWTALALVSLVFAALTGRLDETAKAALDGAGSAVTLCVSLAGAVCLWSGVMELMRRSGLLAGLTRLLRPALTRLFPAARGNSETADALALNVSANLLGLGNAATPAGIRAARLLADGETATDGLCRLVVLNTASIQLIPLTVCVLRAGAGA